MSEIEYSLAAVRKLDGIHQYIATVLKAPETAAKIIDRLVKRIGVLKESPLIGPRLSSRIDKIPERFAEMRFLICDKHIVVYECKESKVLIIAIYHTTEDVFGRVLRELTEL
jgi:plasmid stabilization system protein ParE